MNRYVLQLFIWAVFPVYIGILFCVSLFIRFRSNAVPANPRFVWGPEAIINNAYWSRAMRMAGFSSETYTNGYFSVLHERGDWDLLVAERCAFLPINHLRFYCVFIDSLFRYDIFAIPFSGYYLGLTPLWRFEAFFLKLARKKTILLSYGADSYVYRNVRSPGTLHGLMMSYPSASRYQERIFNKVAYWCRNGDVVISAIQGLDGFGRWDVLIPSKLHIDLNEWSVSRRMSNADGIAEPVCIAHAPNHRGFKGSEFVADSVKKLKYEGLKIDFKLIEKRKNSEVKEMLRDNVDILVEQVICTGHGLNGLEGMASGLPTIANLEDDDLTLPVRRWSYLDECPLVSASPETLTDVLRKLVTRPELRHEIGRAGREYAEKYHGLDSAQYLFGEVVEYLYGRRESLINLYHPLLGEYPNRKPKVVHPLVNNKIRD